MSKAHFGQNESGTMSVVFGDAAGFSGDSWS
jgi:hypothetical protein